MSTETIGEPIALTGHSGEWLGWSVHVPDPAQQKAFEERCAAEREARQQEINRIWAWAPKWLPRFLGITIT